MQFLTLAQKFFGGRGSRVSYPPDPAFLSPCISTSNGKSINRNTQLSINPQRWLSTILVIYVTEYEKQLQTSESSDALTLPHSSSSALMAGAMPVACTTTQRHVITINRELRIIIQTWIRPTDKYLRPLNTCQYCSVQCIQDCVIRWPMTKTAMFQNEANARWRSMTRENICFKQHCCCERSRVKDNDICLASFFKQHWVVRWFERWKQIVIQKQDLATISLDW